MEQVLEFTPELLDNWAAQFPERTRVARRNVCYACPVAEAVAASLDSDSSVWAGYDAITVTTYDGIGGQRTVHYDTPQWARDFMQKIDKRSGGITAGNVRKVLKEILIGIELEANGGTVVSI